MEAYREILSTATAVITEDGTTLWSSPAWQNVIHSAHGWSRPGEAESALSLPEFLEQCHGPDLNPGLHAISVENAHLDPRRWTLSLHPLPEVSTGLKVAELRPEFEADASPSVDAQTETGTLLLVDDEPNILSALRRSLRRSGHRILTAGSGAEGLEILEREAVDIIISDQRMPNMTGVEFLRRARQRWPQTVRISLSGYTDLSSISDAINEGAVFKFITKPWDDTALQATIKEAFTRKQSADQTRRLQKALTQANEEQIRVNARLTALLAERESQMATGQAILEATHAVFSALPVPVLGIDNEGMIVIVNDAAEQLLGPGLMGAQSSECLPSGLTEVLKCDDFQCVELTHSGRQFRVLCRSIGHGAAANGRVLTLLEMDSPS
ncbi:response regulator [Niveibacterium terrae]|uniref:response regulator n=1 Tax=Niveibacterium terrae TaxID=3373598 RepID=UPI003A920F6F